MSRLPVVILGDLHAPFHCRRAVGEAIMLIRDIKPKVIVQIGDLRDMFSFGRFPRSPNVMTPRQELVQGTKVITDLWKNARAAAGKGVECYLLRGNHDERLAKMTLNALPEVEGLLPDLWQFDGVTTLPAERDELILDGVVYMHGYRNHGDHVRYNLMSTVCGHSHTGGVVYMPRKNDILFELNVGYLGNPKAVALSYTKQAKISRWTKGIGVIDDYGPRFIPLGV